MLIIKNGNAFINGKFRRTNIIIDKGKITNIIGNIKIYKHSGMIDNLIDAKGLLILPGLIDAHVHFRDPGMTYKEDFRTGSLAAAHGGITHVIDMPNTIPPTTTKKRYIQKKKIAKSKSVILVSLHMGATKNNFKEIRKTNPNSLKIYMAETTGNLLVPDDKTIFRHFRNFNKNKIIVLHAEDQYYINKTKKRDKTAALIGIQRANELATLANDRRIHIAHASTSDEVILAKSRKNTTVEVAPHYLFLSQKDREKLGWDTFGKVYPPLRPEGERKKLWNAWNNIDIISTDHAPHTIEDKQNGAAGFPGVETSFSLLSTAYTKGKISLQSIIQKMSVRPAELYGFKNEGKIKTGNYANIAIVDIKREWKVDSSKFFSKSKWSPFENKKLKGKVVGTIVKGKIVKKTSEIEYKK